MGCYDIVHMLCPACGAYVEFQSKAGECVFEEYVPESAPPGIQEDLTREDHVCRECGTRWGYSLQTLISRTILKNQEHETE